MRWWPGRVVAEGLDGAAVFDLPIMSRGDRQVLVHHAQESQGIFLAGQGIAAETEHRIFSEPILDIVGLSVVTDILGIP